MSVVQRVNLTVGDPDMKKLKRIYEERYLPFRIGDSLSFTGFCTMMLLFAARIVEDEDLKFDWVPKVRGQGRPKEVKE